MKNFKRASAFLLTLALVLGMFPAMVFATEETAPVTVTTPAATPAVGDNVLFADFGASKDLAWQDDLASKLSDGSKIVATWDSVYLYLVYATKGGAAATVNGKAAIVTAGDTYDVAKIGLAQLGVAPKDYKSYCEVALTVGEATWDGFVSLRSDDKSMVTKNGYTEMGSAGGFVNKVLATDYNWVATGEALGSPKRVNYQAYHANGSTAFYAGSANGYVYDFNLDLTTMPVLSVDDATLAGEDYRPLTTGLTFSIYDAFSNDKAVDAEGNDLKDAANRNQVFFNIVKNASGLKLLSRNADGKYLVTDLDDDLGTQIHVRAEAYYTSGVADRDITLKVYINNKLVLVSSSTRFYDGCLGTMMTENCMGIFALVNNYDTVIRYTDEKIDIQAADVTISDMAISEINGAAFEAKVGVGNDVLFAEFGDSKKDAWENGVASKLSDGSKIVATWDSVNLTLVYATKNGVAVTVNGKAATVTAGDTYDVAKIALTQLGIAPTDYLSQHLLSVAVGDVTWDGFVALTKSNDLGYLRGNGSVAANGVMSYTYKNPTIADGKQTPQVVFNSAQAATIANGVPGADAPTTIAFKLNIAELPTESRADDVLLQGGFLGNYTTGYNNSHVYGLNIYLADPFQVPGSTTVTNHLSRRSVEMHIFKNADGDLRLLYTAGGKYHIAELGYNISETAADLDIRAELHYTSKDSNIVDLHLYVNGKLIVIAENARSSQGDPGGSTADTYRVWMQPVFFETTGTTTSGITYSQFYDLDVTISEVAHTKPVAGAPEQVVAVGNNFLIAPRNGDAVVAFNGGAWNGMGGLLSDGTSKVFAAWDARKLTLVYPTQNGAVATINGKTMTVVSGTTYDTAMVPLDALGLDVQTSCVEFLASFAVNGKTWDGFIYLDELTAGGNNATTGTNNGWANVYSYDHAAGTVFKQSYEMARTSNEFDLDKNPTIVYDMNLSITSLPTQAPAELGKVGDDAYCGQGLTVALGDPYTQSQSANLNAAYTAQRWTPIVIAKDASGNLYIAIWENNAVKYEYIDGIVLDDTTAYNLDVRAEFCHASATSNVTVLKVYVNGVLLLTSNNARYMTTLGTSPLKDTYTIKRGVYTTGEALKLTFEVKQYVQTASEVLDSDFIFAAKGAEADAVWAGAKGQLAAGEKFGIGWYGTCLHIIYAKQDVDTFKVNGKDATVIKGDAYDVAVISYEDLGMEVISGNGCYPLTLEVNGKTWDGFVCLDDLTAGGNNGTGSALTGYQTVYNYDTAAGTQFSQTNSMNGKANDFDLAQNPTVVYDMKLSITSLPAQAPTGLGFNVPAAGGFCGEGLTLGLGDPYTNSSSTNLPAAATNRQWAPIVFAKDADGKLYVAIWENNAWKYEYVDGIVLDGTTAHNLDVRAEFSHESATSNVIVLKVYINGVLFLTSNNARSTTSLGTSNAANTFALNRAVYTTSEALKLTFEVKQYVQTASADFELPEDVEIHFHEYKGEVTKEATCVPGVMTYSCSCGESYTEEIPATDEHNFVYKWDETHHWMECEVCDLEETGERFEHTDDDANCEDDSFCDDCGYKFQSATDHDYNGECTVIIEATCDVDGKQMVKCTRCDSWEEQVIPATGHDYEVTTQDATCTEDGLKTFTCGTCGDTYTEVIPATGHDYVDGTCGNCGEKEPVVEITNGLVFKNDTYYYLVNGVAQTGAVNVTNVNGLDFATGWYRFDGPDGAISNGLYNNSIYINGVKAPAGMYDIPGDGVYYQQSSGTIVKDVVTTVVNPIDGYNTEEWYRFDADGRIYNGLFWKDGYTYYYVNGLTVKSQMVEVTAEENAEYAGVYYLTDNGRAVINNAYEVLTGALEQYGNGWYKFDEMGRMANGWFEHPEYEGVYYYYRDGNKVQNEMIEVDGKIYYIKPNCTRGDGTAFEITNVLPGFEKGWYKFDENGVLCHGFYENDYGYPIFYYKGQKVGNALFEYEGEVYYANGNYVIGERDSVAILNITTVIGCDIAPGWYCVGTDGRLFTGEFNGKNWVDGVAV